MSRATPSQASPEDTEELVESLLKRVDRQVMHQVSSLQRNRESLRMTLIKEAVKDAGIDVQEPGSVHQFYFKDKGVILVDLNGQGSQNGAPDTAGGG